MKQTNLLACKLLILSLVSLLTPLSTSAETFINEDYTWQYRNHNQDLSCEHSFAFMKFHGTKEINNKTYNALYEIVTPWDNAIDVEIPEFDFENLQPVNYIRQEGNKYYMLKGENGLYAYGSKNIESLIYNFDAQVGDKWNICTEMNGDNFPEDYNCCTLPHNVHLQQFYLNESEVTGWEEIVNEGRTWEIQKTKYFDASPEIGCIENGSLNYPGYTNEFQSKYIYLSLAYLYDKDGKIIYADPYLANLGKPDSVDINRAESTESEYFDLFGNKISRPESGICIRKTGNKVEKIVIR